jgi:hypothetical protein
MEKSQPSYIFTDKLRVWNKTVSNHGEDAVSVFDRTQQFIQLIQLVLCFMIYCSNILPLIRCYEIKNV